MQGEKLERVMTLVEQIAVEQDLDKFHSLVVELNDILEEKRHHLAETSISSADPRR